MANSGVGEPDRWLARAEETLGAAKALAEREFYKDSVSRAYYAMFYAAKASVVSEGVRVKKHSAVVAAFGRLFAKSGRLDTRLHTALMDAFEQREDADYLLGVIVSEEDAKESLKAAEEFVSAVKALLATGVQ